MEASDRLGGMADHLVLASLELADELQSALFSPNALTASLGMLTLIPAFFIVRWAGCTAATGIAAVLVLSVHLLWYSVVGRRCPTFEPKETRVISRRGTSVARCSLKCHVSL